MMHILSLQLDTSKTNQLMLSHMKCTVLVWYTAKRVNERKLNMENPSICCPHMPCFKIKFYQAILFSEVFLHCLTDEDIINHFYFFKKDIWEK